MKRASNLTLAVCVALAIAACGRGDVGGDMGQARDGDMGQARDGDMGQARTGAESADAAAASGTAPQPTDDPAATRPGSPFRISYRIIGTPIVGSPVTIELRVESALGAATDDAGLPHQRFGRNAAGRVAAAVGQARAGDGRELRNAAGDDRAAARGAFVPERQRVCRDRGRHEVDASWRSRSRFGSGGRDPLPDGELQIDEIGRA